MYTLRDQLKIQFRATQKAQVNERKAADSKRRLTSYVISRVSWCGACSDDFIADRCFMISISSLMLETFSTDREALHRSACL